MRGLLVVEAAQHQRQFSVTSTRFALRRDLGAPVGEQLPADRARLGVGEAGRIEQVIVVRLMQLAARPSTSATNCACRSGEGGGGDAPGM